MRQDLIWRLEALGFQALFGFLRLLGVERASGLGGWLLRTLGPLTGTQKTVIRNLRIAFPDLTPDRRDALAREQWDRTGRTFAELAVMDRLTPEGGRVEVVGLERLHALRDSGKPAVLISGHLANFEVMAAVIMAAVPAAWRFTMSTSSADNAAMAFFTVLGMSCSFRSRKILWPRARISRTMEGPSA